MNLEEAKANIGKEVVLDESTKPYTYTKEFRKKIAQRNNLSEKNTYTLTCIDSDGDAVIHWGKNI